LADLEQGDRLKKAGCKLSVFRYKMGLWAMVAISALVPAIRCKSSVTLPAGFCGSEDVAPPGLLRAFHSYPAAIGRVKLYQAF
jgi:hypothetical protein